MCSTIIYRSIVSFCSTLLVSFAVYSTAYSATYYIDYEAGKDTNNGISTATSWKHSPGDVNATGNADITLSAGDTVVFKGGSVYEFTASINDYIEINASGSEGNIITYISGHVHASSWGTGRAKFDCTYAKPRSASKYGVFSAYRKGYFTIKGLEMYNLQHIANEYYGFIGFNDGNTGNASYITIDDVLLYSCNSLGLYAAGRYNSGAVPTNLTIKNSTMYDSWGHLIKLRYGWDTVLIENNDLDQAGTDPFESGLPKANCIALAFGDENGQENITVINNRLGDSTATGNKSLILVQNKITNFNIEDNYFYGFPAVSAIDFIREGSNFVIRNNVFHVQPTHFEGILRFWSMFGAEYIANIDGLKIHNNTFVCRPSGGKDSAIIFFKAGTDKDVQYYNVDIRNNIIDTDTETSKYSIYIGNTEDGTDKAVVHLYSLTCDFNSYQNQNVSNKFFYINKAPKTFSEWKSALGSAGVQKADANSLFGQVVFLNEVGDDFHLDRTDTVAANRGADLSNNGFSDDKDGYFRPIGSNWDIGAYELYSELNPPTGLRIVAGD